MKIVSAAVLVLFSFGTLTGCGEPHSISASVRITGGHEVGSSAPDVVRQSVVALASNAEFFNRRSNPSSPFCTGVLISPHLVLTAAHCTEMLDRQMTVVLFARSATEALRDTSARVRRVAAFERHPGYPMEKNDAGIFVSPYSSNPENWMSTHPGEAPHDLAIVKFSGDLPAGFQPAALHPSQAPVPPTALLAGFGITSTYNIADNGVLRYVDGVKVASMDENLRARAWLPIAETVEIDRIMAGQKPRGACPGDSGGPAFAAEEKGATLIGILSLGEGDRTDPTSRLVFCLGHRKGVESKVGNIYTDVRPYQTWIESVRAKLGP